MAGFFGLFARKKIDSTLNDLKGLLVDLDRDTATEADLAQIDGKLRQISARAATAQADYVKEQKEADDALSNYNRQFAIAENLQKQIDATSDADKKASLEKSLNTQLDTLQEAKSSVEKEQAEAADAKGMRDQYQQMVDQIATKLKNRRAELKAAGTRVDRAKLSVERNRDLLDSQKISEGITKGNTTVVDTMNAAAEKYERQAEAMRIQTDALKTPVAPVDDNIAAAAAAVDGVTVPTDTKSRLASLKIN